MSVCDRNAQAYPLFKTLVRDAEQDPSTYRPRCSTGPSFRREGVRVAPGQDEVGRLSRFQSGGKYGHPSFHSTSRICMRITPFASPS
jgi:hypothetical protein